MWSPRRILPALFACALLLGAVPAAAQTGEEIRATVDARRNAVTLFLGSSVADGYLRQLIFEPWTGSWGDDTLVGAAYSRRFARFWRFFMLDGEVGGNYAFGQTNGAQVWAALYLRYDGFPWTEYVYTTFGLSMGPNYATRLPQPERGTAQRPEEHQSAWLNYFSPELSFALPSAPQYEVALRYAHRSGMFGLYNGVWEGSNSFNVGFRVRF